MITRLSFRFLKEVDFRLLMNFMFKFGIKSLRSLNKFKRRSKRGNYFPAFMMISITNACNLDCKGCWVTQTFPPKELSFSEIDNIIIECKKNGVYFFGILGGEPLLHKNLFHIIEKHSDCYFQLFTNGTLITDKIAKKMRKLGNVTPLISVEGLKNESDIRRGSDNVYERSISGIKHCTDNKLVTGVATSICNSNIDELLNHDFVKRLVDMKVHYLWYYIFRPSGEKPSFELALSADQVRRVREFTVNIRSKAPLAVIDTYWDENGKAICPGVTGISHHINPYGDIEFCPPIQYSMENISEKDSLADIFNGSEFLSKFRDFAGTECESCILMENPKKLSSFIKDQKANDTSRRGFDYSKLAKYQSLPCHSMPEPIKEKHFLYKIAKKYSFFGFGAYG